MKKKAMIKLLSSDVAAWNQWREDNPTIQPDLSEAILSGLDLAGVDLGESNLEGADLSQSVLNEANFSRANLTVAKLNRAAIESANFRKADLEGTFFEWSQLDRSDFSGANLNGADFSNTKLRGADFSDAAAYGADFSMADLDDAMFRDAGLAGADFNNAVLTNANFSDADLTGTIFANAYFSDTNFKGASLDETHFTNVNLSCALGLDMLEHRAPSYVDIASIYRSEGKISEAFLRDTGVPEEFIRFIPSLISAQVGIQFYSCFISFSHKDVEFANRLFSKMRDAKLRVWYAPEEMKGGQKLHEQIETAIRVYDKLLVVLSDASLASEWVKTEIRNARRAEKKTGKRKLFPVRLVDMETIQEWGCFDADTGKDLGVELREYFIPDFSRWKDHDKFEAVFVQLLRDLKADTAPPIQ